MLGVVLWSDASVRKAVIWCEDQGDLAFYNCDVDVNDEPFCFFDAGDLVQFEMEVRPALRVARNPKLVIEKASSSLPHVLRANYGRAATQEKAAQIIPFGRKPKERRDAAPFHPNRKNG